MLSIAALFIALPTPSYGQSQPSQVVANRDRATDDSLQRLFEEVGRLRLNSGHELRTVLARSADDELAFRSAIREKCQSWRPHWHPRGPIEVDAWMPISALDSTLASVIQQKLKRLDGQPAMTITWARSNPPAALATGQYLASSSLGNEQPGWRHCSLWQTSLASKAAAADARAAMLTRTGYCRLSGGRELGFVLHQEKKLRAALSSLLNRVPVGDPVFEPTGVCRVDMKLTQPELLRLLQEASQAVEGLKQPALLRSVELAASESLTAEGYAVAPPVPSIHSPPYKKMTGPARPDWADRFLVVQGAGKAPSDTTDEASRSDWAERAAHIEAHRQLWMQIEDLPLDSGETIGLRMTKDTRLTLAMSSLGGFITGTGEPLHADDGAVTVSIGVHLQIVWRILSSIDQTG